MKPIKYTLVLLFLFGLKAYSQLNIPAHFAYIKEGAFKEYSKDSSEVYEHKIASFYMYKFEVSGMDYIRFLRATNKQTPENIDYKLPITNITYSEAQAYCNWLQSIYKVPFRLPTKEEWEYAARGGNFENDQYLYNTNQPNEYVVYKDNSTYNKPKCISCMKPNEFGLYGMVGNVWEWTEQRLKRWKIEIVGGSFMQNKDSVKVTSIKMIDTREKRSDLGFRFVVDAESFKKFLE
tara:strand:- start:67169 stop:67873 length:705 start_codon:yes stop_codon:yes gene_type:complete